MSLDQHSAPRAGDAVSTRAAVPVYEPPTMAESMASALGSVRAEGLEPSPEALLLFDAVVAGELTIDEAVSRVVAAYTA